MRYEHLERMQRQLRPEAWIGLMAALAALAALGAHLLLLRPALAEYRELAGAGSLAELERTAEETTINARTIGLLEKEVAEDKERLYGVSSALPLEKMESFVIDRLDQISLRRGVRLESVKPGEAARVLMFDEHPYDVRVSGNYFDLYYWLHEVEVELRPMAVKRFEMSASPKDARVEMELRLVSYRPSEGAS